MQQKICKIEANQVQELNKEGFIIKQVIKTEQKNNIRQCSDISLTPAVIFIQY